MYILVPTHTLFLTPLFEGCVLLQEITWYCLNVIFKALTSVTGHLLVSGTTSGLFINTEWAVAMVIDLPITHSTDFAYLDYSSVQPCCTLFVIAKPLVNVHNDIKC